jgi:CRP-like cAMP-binding protein
MSRTPRISSSEIKSFLRGIDLFDMLLDRYLDQLVEAGSVLRLSQGQVLFRAGDRSDRMYVVLSGSIEIVRTDGTSRTPGPVAYITPGESIGDLAILTGTHRKSSARAPQPTELWVMDRVAFEAFAASVPGYPMQLARIHARRMENYLTHMRRQASQKELSGRLAHFDMPTVFQTLMTSNQSGVLTILDAQEFTVAKVLLRQGTVARARYGPLEGEDAFHEIFLRGDEGEFRFQADVTPEPESVSSVPIDVPGMSLLMEAMRLKDELPVVQKRLPDLEKPYRRTAREFHWDDPDTEPVAREILSHLKEPKPLKELAGWIACSTFTLYQVAAELRESGFIR